MVISHSRTKMKIELTSKKVCNTMLALSVLTYVRLYNLSVVKIIEKSQ